MRKRVLALTFTFGLMMEHAPLSANSVLFDCFVASYDSKFVADLEAARLARANLELSGYDYQSSEGILVNDTGFVTSFRKLPPTTRRTTLVDGKAKILRGLPTMEVDQVRMLAQKAVLDSYEGLIQPDIRDALNQVEDQIEPSQLTFAVATDLHSKKVLGVVRVVNAYLKDGKVCLPALEVMRRRKLLRPRTKNLSS